MGGHECNAYCRAGVHAFLTYCASALAAEQRREIEYHFRLWRKSEGWEALIDVLPAHEAPPPSPGLVAQGFSHPALMLLRMACETGPAVPNTAGLCLWEGR